MAENEDFIDYYELLQINIGVEPEAIQRVYRILASRYHPDNTETGDIERFLLIKKAYEVLSDPEKRAEYDKTYEQRKDSPIPIFLTKEFTDGVDGEANRRMGVLCLLYTKRRTSPAQPALSVLEIENTMYVPREHLTFTVWYLKSKRYIQSDDRSSLVITAEGIDYLEASLPQQKTIHKLLKAAEVGATRSGTAKTHFTTGWAETGAKN